MKAVTFQGAGDVKVEDVADPKGADSSRGAPSWATSSWGSSRSSDPR